MDVLSALLILVRRWYITLPALALVGVLAVSAYSESDQRMSAYGSVLVIKPNIEVTDEILAQNSYLQLGSERAPAKLVMDALGTDGRRATLAEDGATYSVGFDPSPLQLPVIDVYARAGSAEAAVATAQNVIDAFRTDLEAMQSAVGAPEQTWLRTQVISEPTLAAESDYVGRTLTVGLIVAVGLTGTVALAFFTEGATVQLAAARGREATARVRRGGRRARS
ncbi:hypothetical protein [Jiangella mangrovi]|uniref:Polysaccharide chain length determinant N-terminal domain-containing protein n=1 Tax=Jiangella mangrovi TaxID=1524084 RepID=A0A7W9GM44_9ACTN|nr:hypothetical protein [Jiangella mangrovi]MBB5786217.1 hypothetical protein [Jiangella mangrovi]